MNARAEGAVLRFAMTEIGTANGWFFAISGSIVLVLTLGCMLAVTDGDLISEMSGIAILCGSPTLILGGVFLWLGSRRLKR